MQEPSSNRQAPRWLGTVVLVIAITGAALSGLYGPLTRLVGVALAFPLLVLGLQLFYRLSLRGRGVGSVVFWRVWVIVCVAVLAAWRFIEARGEADL